MTVAKVEKDGIEAITSIEPIFALLSSSLISEAISSSESFRILCQFSDVEPAEFELP